MSLNNGAPKAPHRFPGVWINSYLWMDKKLSWSEKAVVAEIDALTTADGPCQASNAHLAEMVNLSQVRARIIVEKLQSDGVVIRLGFHRTFAERVVCPKYSKDPKLSQHWINSSLHENGKAEHSRVIENDQAGGSRVIENDHEGCSKTNVEGDRKRSTEYSLKYSLEQGSAGARTHPPKKATKKNGSTLHSKPSDIEEFVAHGKERGGTDQDCRDLFQIWIDSDWHDGFGNKIINWKGKLTTFIKTKRMPSDRRRANSNSSNAPKQKGFCDI
jgi:hypothetical protein